jgi:glutamate N-acetyltransferase/amino-acid N-acetyltransferase
MAGIRKAGRADLVVIQCEPGTTAAAAFTQSHFVAAPVLVAKAHLARAEPRALVINTGFANAATGDVGRQDALACCVALARELGCRPEEILPFSTGVIGERLPVAALVAGLPAAIAAATEDGWLEAAHGIMTTDTIAKASASKLVLDDGLVRLVGIAKGSGMIHPQMATMLAFFTTDAAIEKRMLDSMLHRAVERSFHRVSVDGDQSTNDMALIWANGASGVSIEEGEDLSRLEAALTRLARHGARLMAADGEGASHLITVRVAGAVSEADAALKARAVAASALVKAAVYGRDPNWGRVLAAAGTQGRSWDPERASLTMNGFPLFVRGEPVVGGEAAWSASMDRPEIEFVLDLAEGGFAAEAYGCDLTEGYVEINAHYRT